MIQSSAHGAAEAPPSRISRRGRSIRLVHPHVRVCPARARTSLAQSTPERLGSAHDISSLVALAPR